MNKKLLAPGQLIRLTLLFVVALLTGSCSEEPYGEAGLGDSRMFRGNPEHTGVSDALPFARVALRWRFETGGAIRGSASISGQTLFIGSGDGFLYALDTETGKEKWKFRTDGAVYGTPAVYRDAIIFSGRDQTVYSVTREEGELLWKFQTGKLPAHKWGWDYFVSSPTVVDDYVIIGSEEGAVYCLEAATGKTNWRFQTRGRIRATPAVSQGTVYIGSYDSRFYALELETGNLRWEFETDGAGYDSNLAGWDRNSIDSSPAIADTVVVFGSRDGNVYALNTETGRPYWKFSYGPTWAISSPSIAQGVVYIGWSDNFLFAAIDLRSGREKWKYPCGYYVYSSPLLTDSVVYFGSHDRNVYAVHSRTGRKLWQYRTGGGVLSSPITDGDALYVGSDDGYLYALERTDNIPPERAVFAPLAPPKYQPVDPRLGPYLMQFGYVQLDTLSLETYLTDRIADRKASVIVFATDRLPQRVIHARGDASPGLMRQYLDAGGKVVWLGAVPNLYQFDGQGNIVGEDAEPASKMLGMTFDATHDWGGYFSKPTEEGVAWGLGQGWVSAYSIPAQNGVTVLSTNDQARPSAWVKGFGGIAGTGFVFFRPWEADRRARDNEIERVRKVAEYGLVADTDR